jgi:hypothetical protein
MSVQLLVWCCTAVVRGLALVDWLQTKLEEMEREVLEVNANNERLQRTHAELAELQVKKRRQRKVIGQSQLATAEQEGLQHYNGPKECSRTTAGGISYTSIWHRMRLGSSYSCTGVGDAVELWLLGQTNTLQPRCAEQLQRSSHRMQ